MTIDKTFHLPGNITDGPTAHQPYDDIATESNSLSEAHTRTEWASTLHIKEKAIYPYFGKIEYYATSDTYNNTAWQTISHGGIHTILLLPAVTLKRGDVLRIHGGCQVEATGTTNILLDLVSFRFLANITVDGGAAADVQLGHDWGYGTISRPSTAGNYTEYAWFRVGQSWVHICNNDTELITNIQYQVKIEDATNVVKIGAVSLMATVSTH